MSDTNTSSINSASNTLDFSQFGSNASFVQELYSHYLTDPTLVGAPWVEFFSSLEQLSLNNNSVSHSTQDSAKGVSLDVVRKQAQVSRLIDAFRSSGHFHAKINPLSKGVVVREEKEELSIQGQGLSKGDLDNPYFTDGLLSEGTASLSEIISKLEDTYSAAVGAEFMHLTELSEREFLRSKIENESHREFSLDERKAILKYMSDAESLEAMLHKRFVGAKRFSLEGGEASSAAICFALDKLANLGAKKVRIGMAHRGRLSTVVNIAGKPLSELICEFEDRTFATDNGNGDVKYHLGASSVFTGHSGASLEVSVSTNPSHLEFVNPVVTGQVRADQDIIFEKDRSKSVPFLIHGDSAFAGQGVVFETLNFVGTKGYDTGGTLHLVINNQIGFTATEDESRGTTYCTDMAKGINAPVFHVNGEDPEAVVWAVELACEFRQKFSRDVIIDLICFRKYGHNEGDDPTFTQPAMYQEIKQKNPVTKVYVEKLKALNIDLSAELELFSSNYKESFERAAEDALKLKDVNKILVPVQEFPKKTSIKKDDAIRFSQAAVSIPEKFNPHQKLFALLTKRSQAVTAGEGIEWGVSEGIAFASLLADGFNIRISGQDACRGTFSHRHCVLDNVEQTQTVIPLNSISKNGSELEAYNSVLSECAVMGFEYGYANVAQKSLVIWEAQFGDFANGAQVMIDQFLAAGESKWGTLSNLVLLLPHGFEGQGPEHSSARLERFLQLSADNNWAVYYPSNGAQYFHILRRHAYSKIKRPTIIMTPKSLLRLPDASVKLTSITSDEFKPVISEIIGEDKKADKTFIMTGKVYYDVTNALKKQGLSAKIIRLEQLFPAPLEQLKNELQDKNIYWVQEEPKNQGAWSYVRELMLDELNINPVYIGRQSHATTACGSGKRHQLEQSEIINDVISKIKDIK